MIDPAHLWIPPRVGSYGDEAVDLAAEAGRSLDDEQRLAVDALLSYGPGGRWAALESAVIEARQNGKTSGVLLPVVLFDLFVLAPDRIVWTAHLFRTSRDAFDDFIACIESSSVLSRRVKKVNSSHGEESIVLSSGAKLEFLARQRGGGRGLGGKRVVMDEALILQPTSVGALIPTLSARPDPQINYGSSACLETSEHLWALKNRGRAGGDPSLVWVEWCAPGAWDDPPCRDGVVCTHKPGIAIGCALDDESLWPLANHSIGDRITYEFVRSERRAMPPEEFGRERLGWHQNPAGEGTEIDPAVWARTADAGSRRDGAVALAVDLSPRHDHASIGLVGVRADGLEHMQVTDSRPGTVWVVPRMVELRDTLNPLGWAMNNATFEALEAELEKNDFQRARRDIDPQWGQLAVLTAAELSAAAGHMLAACRPSRNELGELVDGFRHQDQHELNVAVAAARVRQSADSVAWSRKDSTSEISPVVAVTEARWLYVSWAHLVADYDVLESAW